MNREWNHPTLTRDQFEERGRQLLREESDDPAAWWYLSFAESAPPAGRGFLGGVLIKASGMLSAITGASLLGLNPGGEVAALPTPYADDEAEQWAYRLLTRGGANDAVTKEPRRVMACAGHLKPSKWPDAE